MTTKPKSLLWNCTTSIDSINIVLVLKCPYTGRKSLGISVTKKDYHRQVGEHVGCSTGFCSTIQIKQKLFDDQLVEQNINQT